MLAGKRPTLPKAGRERVRALLRGRVSTGPSAGSEMTVVDYPDDKPAPPKPRRSESTEWDAPNKAGTVERRSAPPQPSLENIGVSP
jgi:hypothetical protein